MRDIIDLERPIIIIIIIVYITKKAGSPNYRPQAIAGNRS
jgi:hypothetical protein